MQTYSQTFTGAQTWALNIPGKYFITLECPAVVNVRFYKSGQKLDLGDITGLGVGLEVGPLAGLKEENAFDRVEIDIPSAGTFKIGIGNGAARYNNSVSSVTIVSNKVAQVAATQSTKAVTNASSTLLAANAARQSLQVQNKDAAGTLYLSIGVTPAVAANCIEIGPKGSYEFPAGTVDTQAIYAISNIASISVIVVEG